jgi:hypothetical protein
MRAKEGMFAEGGSKLGGEEKYMLKNQTHAKISTSYARHRQNRTSPLLPSTDRPSYRKRVLTSPFRASTSIPCRKEIHFAVPAVLALSRRCSPLQTVNLGQVARETTVSLPMRVQLVVLTWRELKLVPAHSVSNVPEGTVILRTRAVP